VVTLNLFVSLGNGCVRGSIVVSSNPVLFLFVAPWLCLGTGGWQQQQQHLLLVLGCL